MHTAPALAVCGLVVRAALRPPAQAPWDRASVLVLGWFASRAVAHVHKPGTAGC